MQTDRTAPSVTAGIGDVRTLRDSWHISLQAVNLSENTLATYSDFLDSFMWYLLANGMPTQVASLTREHIDAWLADLAKKARLDRPHRFTGVRMSFLWAQAEGEITETPMRNMNPGASPGRGSNPFGRTGSYAAR